MNIHRSPLSENTLTSDERRLLERALQERVPSLREFSMEDWIAQLEQSLYKKIRIFECALPAWFFGARVVLLNDENMDERPTEIVIVSNTLSPILRAHTTLHELAHIALGHATLVLSPKQMASLQTNKEGWRIWNGATCRALTTQPQDNEKWRRDIYAETLTRMIEQRHITRIVESHLQRHASDPSAERMIVEMLGESLP